MALKPGEFSFNGVSTSDFSNIWLKHFDPGVEPVQTSDVHNPLYDDTFMGADFYRGPTWVFEVVCEGDTPAEVMDNVGRLKRAWRPSGAKRGGNVYPLRFNFAGRERLVWGRPRKLSHSPANTAIQGYVVVELEFTLSDPIVYSGGSLLSVQLRVVPPTARGLKEILVEPLTTGGSTGVRQGQLELDGDAPTPFQVTVYGPISKPFFSINGRKYGFNLNLREGESLSVNSRTGTATVGSKNVIGLMTKRTRLRGVRLPASGKVEVSFGGHDPTGLARCVYAWRTAYHSL